MYATVQELVDALTPEEKAGLCTGAAVPRLGLPALRVNGLHSQESAGGRLLSVGVRGGSVV